MKGEKVVLTLMEPLFYKNYKLYVDRFFTSPSLAQKLLEKTHSYVEKLFMLSTIHDKSMQNVG
jgi:hypothetical protein